MKNDEHSVRSLPARVRKRVHIGSCSWNYPEWEEIGVYTGPQKKHYDYLPEYAQHFNTAEVDQWFWSLDAPDSVRLPKKEDVEAYADLTPGDFKFTVKAPNAITLTHFYKQADRRYADKPNPHFLSKKLTDAFLKSLKPLEKKIGVVMFEFEYLNKEKMISLPAFLDHLGPFLDSLPSEIPFAIETRNPNYLKTEYFDFLKSHNTGHVFVDGYYMPAAANIFEEHGRASLPTRYVVVRLLGSDRQGIEKKTRKRWTQIVDPRDKTIKEIAEFVKRLLPQKFDVYTNFNNHLEGSAPLSIAKFVEYLGDIE